MDKVPITLQPLWIRLLQTIMATEIETDFHKQNPVQLSSMSSSKLLCKPIPPSPRQHRQKRETIQQDKKMG